MSTLVVNPVGVRAVLVDARALLARPYGWTKNKFRGRNRRGEHCYCAIGALQTAADTRIGFPTGRTLEVNQTYYAARAALLGVISSDDRPLLDLSVWNDSKSTRKKDVLDAFDRAIALIDKEI